jgi:CAAX protease family protein
VALMPFGVTLLADIVIYAVLGWHGGGAGLLLTAIQQGALGAGTLWWVRTRYGSYEPLGLWPGGWSWRDVGTGAAAGLGALVASAIVIAITMAIVRAITGHLPEPSDPLRSFGDVWLLPTALLAVFVAPVCEEIAFRGFLFGGLRLRIRFFWAAIASGALFGLVHGDPIRMVGLAVTGVILAGLYERRRTLVASIAAHFTNNLIVVTIGIFVHVAR